MKTLMITGVCGAGKTTITRELSGRLGLIWGDYADFMLEVMQETNKDKIQYLDWEERRRIYDQVEKLIAAKFDSNNSDDQIYLLENHLTIIQGGEIISFPVADYEKYNMVGLVTVEASPQTVFKRRAEDGNRERLAETVALIRRQQEANRLEAEKIAKYFGIPCLNITNNDGRPPVLEFESWMRSNIRLEETNRCPERS